MAASKPPKGPRAFPSMSLGNSGGAGSANNGLFAGGGKAGAARTASPREDDPESSNPSRARGLGQKILQSEAFEHLMAAVIVANFVLIIIETDKGAENAEIPIWMTVMSWALLITFVIELLLKLFTLRSSFHYDRWNVFDLIVISVDFVMSIASLIDDKLFSVSGLRVLRLARLARATKVVQVFPELRLMLAGLAGAMNAIFWGTLLLFSVVLIFSVVAVQFIHPLNLEIASNPDYNSCPRCSRAYSSTFQAALTFVTQIVAGDSWGRETVPIIEHYPATAIYFAAVYLSVGLALLNLMLGVVVNVATEERERILKQMEESRKAQRLEAHDTLYQMCQDMDEDGNMELTMEEIKHGYENNEDFRKTLEKMDIGSHDLDIVWTILDSDRSGTITSQEFVTQVYKMKSSDTQFMLAYIKFYITEIKDNLIGGQLRLRDDLKLGQEQLVQKLRYGQEELQRKLRSGQEELQRKLRGGQEKLRQDMRSYLGLEKESFNDDIMPDRVSPDLVGIDIMTGWVEASAIIGDGVKLVTATQSGTTVCSIDHELQLEALQSLVERTRVLRAEAELAAKSSSPVTEHAEILREVHGLWEQCLVAIDEPQQSNTYISELLASQTKCLLSVIQRLTYPSRLPTLVNGSMKDPRACCMCGTVSEANL